MTEMVRTGIPTAEEWDEVSVSVSGRIPHPEHTITYTEREGQHLLVDMLKLIHINLIKDAYTAQHFFGQGRYSAEDYAQIKGGIIRAYHVYKESKRLGYNFTLDRVTEVKKRYQYLTGQYNFN